MEDLNPTNISYLKALRELHETEIEVSPRNMKVKEVLGYRFRAMNPKQKTIVIPGFETNIEYAEEELKWYYSGSNRIDFSPIIQKTWKQFSDDGIHVNSAYGHRIFGKHPRLNFDQWLWCINKLKEDRDSRQAIININSWFDKETPTKDFPCTVFIQVFIRDNKLYWLTNMRSQDIVLGTRNDIYCFMSMQERMANELKVDLGSYIHYCGSLHIYEKHFKKLEDALIIMNKNEMYL